MVYSIQYMRAIAALMVVVNHSAWKGEQYSSNPLSWFNVGGIGVDLCFIISGYIMCNTVDLKEINIFSFMTARVNRIIPLYWVLTTLALIIFLIFPERVNSSGGDTSIIASYLLIPTESKYLINNGWTLSYEFLFYFLFSFCLFFHKPYRCMIPVGVIFGLVFLGGMIRVENIFFNFATNQYLLEFAFGIIAFYFSRKIKCNVKYGVLLVAISVFIIFLVNNEDYGYPRVIVYGIPSLIFFLGMLLMEAFFKMNNENIFYRALKNIGDSSYSLYLFHPFPLVAASIIFNRIGVADFGWFFVGGLVIISVVSGHLCYLFLEKPLIKFMKTNKMDSK